MRLLLILLTLLSFNCHSEPLRPMIPQGVINNPEARFELWIAHVVNLDSSRPNIKLALVIREIKGKDLCISMAKRLRELHGSQKLNQDEFLMTRCELADSREI